MTKKESELLEEIENLKIEVEKLQNDLDCEINEKMHDRIKELEFKLEDKIDINGLILQMKKDNVYTKEFDEYLENYFKFYA